MTVVRISGIIVPQNFYFFTDDIEAGVLTTPAEVAYAVASAHDGLEIVLNSYGGDVFAANTISNTIARWAVEHPDLELTFTVDAIALSAAAVILAKAPANAVTRAHRDSLIMFHSAACAAVGGPGAMKDCAALMDKINGSIRSLLIQKTDISPDTVDKWLSEGRMGWLTGEEACNHGLVGELVNSAPGEKPRRLTPEEEDALAMQPQIAASYRSIADLLNTHIKEQNMNIHNEDEEKEKEKEKEEAQDTQTAKTQDAEGEDEDKDKKPETEETEEDKEKEKDEEIANLKQQVVDLQARCEKAEKSLERLTAGLRNSAPAQTAPKTFADMLAAIPANIPQAEWDDRFLALKKEHPDAFNAWMKRKNNK